MPLNIFSQIIYEQCDYFTWLLYRVFTDEEACWYFFEETRFAVLFQKINLKELHSAFHHELYQLEHACHSEENSPKEATEYELPIFDIPDTFLKDGLGSNLDKKQLFKQTYFPAITKIITAYLQQHPEAPCSSLPLAENVTSLSHAMKLNPAEQAILLFYAYLSQDDILDKACDQIPEANTLADRNKNLSSLLGIDVADVNAALQLNSRLRVTGLLERKSTIRGISMKEALPPFELPTELSETMAAKADINTLISHSIELPRTYDADLADFNYIAETEQLVQLIKRSTEEAALGINILIYGAPGTGKTSYANALIAAADLKPRMVRYRDREGKTLSAEQRLQHFCMCQQALAMFKDSAIVFDECDEVFAAQSMMSFFSMQKPVSKNHINSSLETGALPSIFLCNDISTFDQAALSRFAIILRMPNIDLNQRRKLLQHKLAEQLQSISPAWVDKVSRQTDITPRQIENSIRVAKLAQTGQQNLEQVVDRLLNSYLQHSGQSKGLSLPACYDPSLVHCDYPIEQLIENIGLVSDLKLLLHGIPGTGKTAFAQYLLQTLQQPYLMVRSSDILGRYVGQSEQNIAKAFQKAHEEHKAIIIDEVDSLVSSRAELSESWQRTMVNEFLTQLEHHPGRVFATTNFMTQLDPAVYRRFSAKIELRPLAPCQAEQLFAAVAQEHQLQQDIAQEQIQGQLGSLSNLTPGDFHAVARRAAWLSITTHSQFLSELAAEVAHKMPKQSIGFLG